MEVSSQDQVSTFSPAVANGWKAGWAPGHIDIYPLLSLAVLFRGFAFFISPLAQSVYLCE
jgi:hypothetical protein